MTDAAAAAYAVVKVPDKAKSRGETVAEFRNKINPITGYYDQWDIDEFFMDKSISLETKIEVLFGRFIGKVVAEYGADKLAALGTAFMKKEN